jgi:3,4-dihydroxy 2-butanone 4-phosphate synthase/GTP cyclohydrolase II
MSQRPLASIKQAIDDLRQGRMVILVDDEKRENEGDIIIAAEKITPAAINFMISHGRGLVCMPMMGEDIDRLNLPVMVRDNKSKYNTAFTVSIGAAQGITTGISAADRAHTVKVAISSASKPSDIVSPGHIFPLRAREGGVLVRAGHTEGSIDLVRLAGLQPAAVLCEVIKDDGSMARLDDLFAFADKHGLSVVSIADLVTYRIMQEALINEVSAASLPLEPYGDFKIKVFESVVDGSQHVALIRGDINNENPTLVRVHSQCFTGDIFGSLRCDCGWQLQTSLAKIGKEGGVLLYMNQEGRGIGLANKIKAYALQDHGMDTVEANQKLGFLADHRDYGIAAQILKYLHIQQIRLLTNNPKKIEGMQRYGIDVSGRESIEMPPTKDNITYLLTKREKLGHLLSFTVEK